MSGIFGGSGINNANIGIRAGGLTGFLGDNNSKAVVLSDRGRQGLVFNLASLFGRRGTELGRLRDKVAPGFGQITESRVQAVDRARQRSVSDLRGNLARRRISGSSFGSDTLARAEREFAQAEADVRARSFLEELDASTRLLELQSNAELAQVQTFINELNLQADIALQLSNQFTQSITANNRLLSELAVANASGIGAFGAFAFDKIFGDKTLLDFFNSDDAASGGFVADRTSRAGGMGGV